MIDNTTSPIFPSSWQLQEMKLSNHSRQSVADLDSRLLSLIFDERSLQLAELSRAFNPFRVLRVETYELRHTNTLAWLLTPSGSHGLGSAFATQFLKAVCAQKLLGGIEALGAIAQSDLDAIHVRQEVSVEQLKTFDKSEAAAAIDGTLAQIDEYAVDDDEKNGRLDILVESSDWLVAIEAKVRSKQGEGQLSKYGNALSCGAEDRHKILVYLTNDLEEGIPSDWTAMSWKIVVGDPLRKIVERLPETRKTEPQIAFLQSFLEILDENSLPAEGIREDLLSGLISDYSPLLEEIRVRKNSNTLTTTQFELVRRHSDLINALEERYKPANQQRAEMLKELIKNDSRFELLKSDRMYQRFILKEWAKIDWLKVPGARGHDSAVLAEMVNFKNGGIQLKLQIRHLATEDEFQDKRQRLLKLIQQDPRLEVRMKFPRIFTSRGLRKPDDYYFTLMSTEQLMSPEADTQEGASSLINGEFMSSLQMMTEFISQI